MHRSSREDGLAGAAQYRQIGVGEEGLTDHEQINRVVRAIVSVGITVGIGARVEFLRDLEVEGERRRLGGLNAKVSHAGQRNCVGAVASAPSSAAISS